MKITTVGIDLAKNVFQIHAVDERRKVVVKKQLKRNQVTWKTAPKGAINLGDYVTHWLR